jgi:hypothetical protein
MGHQALALGRSAHSPAGLFTNSRAPSACSSRATRRPTVAGRSPAAARARQAFAARHRQKDAQIVPVHHPLQSCKCFCQTLPLFWHFARVNRPQHIRRIRCRTSATGSTARVAGTSGRFADVFNPATGEVQARVALATPAELDAAVAERRQGAGRLGRHQPAAPRAGDDGLRRPDQRRTWTCWPSWSAANMARPCPTPGDVQRGLEVIEVCMGAPAMLKGEYMDMPAPASTFTPCASRWAWSRASPPSTSRR